jgi:putative hydrolase of HD superfamily
MKRTGWILRGVKDPETIAEHTFRMALMAWIFGYSKGLHVEKILKMALIHDLCEIYSGDSTPYDSLLGKKKKIEIKKLVSKWPGFSKAEKERLYKEKQKRERKALEKVIETLSPNFKKEILAFWEDYERGLTK